jgi:hypothetical protein
MPIHIRVGHIFKESFKSVWEHKLDWVRVASTAFLIWGLGLLSMGLMDMAANHYAGLYFSPERHLLIAWRTDSSWVAFGHLLYSLCAIVAVTVLYINGYRYAVLGEGGDRWISMGNPRRIGKFILYSFLLSGAATLLLGGAVLLYFELLRHTSYGIALACVGPLGLLGVYMFFRITFVKLLIPLDISHPIRTSWQLLEGNVLRMVALNVLIALSLTILLSLGVFFLLLVGFALDYTGMSSSLLATVLEKEFLLGLGSIFGGLVWIFSWAVLTKAYAFAFEAIAEGRE